MKAYRVWNASDEWQELVFASHHSTAKWEVAHCFVGDYKGFRAERLPHMDGYGDPFSKRGYIERNKHLQRLSGIYPCERCGGPNGDGSLCCAKCEDK